MEITIVGSGGAIRIPRVGCLCAICNQAREKSYPYKRLGQSLYLPEIGALFDTPEDSFEALNCRNIRRIESIFYSHWHPDHTMGMRVIEHLMEGYPAKDPINVYVPPEGIDLSVQRGITALDYYSQLQYCHVVRHPQTIFIGDYEIERIPLENGFASAFRIRQGSKTMLFCPCHAKHFPIRQEYREPDVFVMNLGELQVSGEDVTGFQSDNLRLIRELKPRMTVFTHIEETYQMGYDDYCRLEKDAQHLRFAYDGMQISL